MPTSSAHPRLLVIGLDGAAFDLLKRWVTDGTLPAFARWLDAGAHGPLRSIPNLDPAWATFATGLNPANHGIFHEMDWSTDHRSLRLMQAADLHGQPFWRTASDAGRRALVIHARFTYPAQPINGILVAGADSPDENTPHFGYPPHFLSNFRRQVGQYRLASQIQALIKENRMEDAIKDIFSVEAHRTEALLFAMAQSDWDLAVITFDLPDAVQHFFWQQMAADDGPQRDAIQESYCFVEQQIERLLAQAGENTITLVLSDHGFGPICTTPEYLSSWLSSWGFLHRFDSKRQSLTQAIYARLRRQLGEPQKATLRRWLPGLRGRVEAALRLGGIDWAATTAYVGLSPCEVWINVRGREPQGIVTPGADYNQVRDAVIAELVNWHNPAGQPYTQAIYRRENIYHGPFLDRAADITIEWNPVTAPPAASLPGNTSHFDGDHQPEGFLLAIGPGIKANTVIQKANLQDIAPTILNLLGITSPPQMDGHVLVELIQSE